MSLKNSTSSYGSITKMLHWLIFLFVLGLLFVGYFAQDIGDKAIRSNIINMHKLTGLLVLFLMLFRALWAFVNIKPALPAETPFWQRIIERIIHLLMYIVLIAMPISGWIMTSASGKPPRFFSWILSLPVLHSKSISENAWQVHQAITIIILVLVSIHVLAAFYHYFIKKDNVLQRMLP
jgi:cytochrome b561